MRLQTLEYLLLLSVTSHVLLQMSLYHLMCSSHEYLPIYWAFYPWIVQKVTPPSAALSN